MQSRSAYHHCLEAFYNHLNYENVNDAMQFDIHGMFVETLNFKLPVKLKIKQTSTSCHK